MKLPALLTVFTIFVSPVFAQEGPLQGGPWEPGHSPMYVGQGISQPVFQDSGPAGGGGIDVGLSEQLLVARGTGAPPYASQGTGPNGTNWCDYDAPLNSINGYHYLCLSANADGGGLVTYGSGGGAPTLPLQFLINGLLTSLSGGNVGTVSNADGSLTISPTTGAVVASINPAHANTWTAPQDFGGGSILGLAGYPPDTLSNIFAPSGTRTTADPVIYVARATTYSAGVTYNPTIYAETAAAFSASTAWAVGVASILDISGNTAASGNPFGEAMRGVCYLGPGITKTTTCEGGVFIASSVGTAVAGLFSGIEGTVDPGIASPTPPSFPGTAVNSSFIASSNGLAADAGFLINPYNTAPFQAGFSCAQEQGVTPGSIINYGCFVGAVTAPYGLSLQLGHWTTAQILGIGFGVDPVGNETALSYSITGSTGPIGQYIETLEPIDIAATATFTNGSAVIGVTQTLQAGAVVHFTTSSALPTNFVVGTLYYVSPTGLSGTTIQLNAAPFNGTSILAGSAGTGTQTLHTQVPMTSTSDYTLAALQVPAGTWDCEASGAFDAGATSVSYIATWIATGATCATPAEPADPGVHGAKSSFSLVAAGAGVGYQNAIKRYPITVGSSTTMCVQGTSTFATGTTLGYGQIDCIRRQ